MKKNLKILTLIVFFTFILQNKILINNSIKYGIDLWKNNIFPSLFPMIIINDILLSLNIANNFTNKYNYIYLCSFFSGSPNNAYIIKNLYDKKLISQKFANYSLLTINFCNPLFLINILSKIFSKKITIKLLLISYTSKLILSLIYIKNTKCNYIIKEKQKFDLNNSLRKSLETNLTILTTVLFYIIIANLITYNLKTNEIIKTLLKGLIEITQGLDNLKNINVNINIKEIITLFIISFSGISIHSQVKNIISKTNLKYTYFLKGRIIETIISITVLILIESIKFYII